MKIKYFCPLWGTESYDFNLFLKKVKAAGYDGVEMSLPIDSFKKGEIISQLREFDLQLIAQHWETSTENFPKHRIEYRKRLENLATAKPLFINSQTGKDYFSFDQNAKLIEIANGVSQKYGVKIIHETHRGKFSFAAHITANYLQKIPDLKLTLDISHWCNVAESYLADQLNAVELAISRAEHIHARVGFPEGPQIPDPRTPEWKETLNIHLAWWKRVIEQRKKDGWTEFTISPEFGPFPYMTILPTTKEPISNQWEINVFMMDFLKNNLD